MCDVDLTLERERLDRVRRESAVVVEPPSVFRVTGPGALACLQGLFTNDLEKPGDESLVYGAMLTPKGMIVTDAWIARHGPTLILFGPARGREAMQAIFLRGLPPRLARAEDTSDAWAVAWVLGDRGFHTLVQSGIGAPDTAGRVSEQGPLLVALAPDGAPFAALVAGPVQDVETAARRLQLVGALRGDARDLHAARILAGWPALGAEIDERTLPQEVRYDEIGGVSYTKGCYTGQETVARLHFRVVLAGSGVGNRREEGQQAAVFQGFEFWPIRCGSTSPCGGSPVIA